MSLPTPFIGLILKLEHLIYNIFGSTVCLIQVPRTQRLADGVVLGSIM